MSTPPPSAATTMRAAIAALASSPSLDARTEALVHIRALCVDAEGPGDAFARSARGQRLVALIHVVVKSCGLEDKVGALTALRLLKTDDLALHAYASAGVIPAVLEALERSLAEDEGGRPSAHAARALSALASSPDVAKMLIRSGAIKTLSKCIERAASAGDDAEDARYAVEALTRVSQRASALNARALFPMSSDPTDVDVTCERAVESMVMMLSSDVSVAHAECAIGLRDLALSGDAGRRAVARCGSVMPLATTALAAGGGRVRDACMEALRAVATGVRDTASASALNFFHALIDALTNLLHLRCSLEPAAADAALALWALVWQPSNNAYMVHCVTGGLFALARDGCATSRDDALSVLSVLARDDDGRKAIYAQGTQGIQVLDYLVAQEKCSSPRASSQGLTFDEVLSSRRSASSLGHRENSSSALSLAMSRLDSS